MNPLLQAGEARLVQEGQHELWGKVEVHPKRLGRQQRRGALMNISAMFNQMDNQMFRAIPDIEFMPKRQFCLLSTEKTVLEPVVNFLNGYGISTDGTVGDLVDRLRLSRQELHYLACWCLGETISGRHAAFRFRRIAERRGPVERVSDFFNRAFGRL